MPETMSYPGESRGKTFPPSRTRFCAAPCAATPLYAYGNRYPGEEMRTKASKKNDAR